MARRRTDLRGLTDSELERRLQTARTPQSLAHLARVTRSLRREWLRRRAAVPADPDAYAKAREVGRLLDPPSPRPTRATSSPGSRRSAPGLAPSPHCPLGPTSRTCGACLHSPTWTARREDVFFYRWIPHVAGRWCIPHWSYRSRPSGCPTRLRGRARPRRER